MSRRLRTTATALLAAVLTVPAVVEAGPPAICHQFQTGGAPSLPWAEGSGWRRPMPGYDLSRLTEAPASRLRRLLRDLEAAGYVRRTGERASARYHLVPPVQEPEKGEG